MPQTASLALYCKRYFIQPVQKNRSSKMKQILLVEDSSLYSKILSYILENSGYNVECAINGTQAMEMVNKKIYDLIVTDILMPGFSGLDLLSKIKNTETTRNTKVIIISILTNEYYMNESMSRGADDYLKKPVTAQDFVHSVKRVLYTKAA